MQSLRRQRRGRDVRRSGVPTVPRVRRGTRSRTADRRM